MKLSEQEREALEYIEALCEGIDVTDESSHLPTLCAALRRLSAEPGDGLPEVSADEWYAEADKYPTAAELAEAGESAPRVPAETTPEHRAAVVAWVEGLPPMPPAPPREAHPAPAVSEASEVRLWDSQWVNVVNNDRCYHGWELEEAIAHAVRMTERYIAQNVKDGKLPPPRALTAALRSQS